MQCKKSFKFSPFFKKKSNNVLDKPKEENVLQMKQIRRIIDSSTVMMLFIIIFICSYAKTLLTFSTLKYIHIWEGCFKWPFSFPADIILNIAGMVKPICHVIFFPSGSCKENQTL